jgi:hypothetical protein
MKKSWRCCIPKSQSDGDAFVAKGASPWNLPNDPPGRTTLPRFFDRAQPKGADKAVYF